MSKINMEIIEYIRSADFDEKFKSFFIKAIIYEIRNPNKLRFTDSYENMINSSMEE